MTALSIEQFDQFFEALWGKTPFAWQRVLAERVLTQTDAPWPEAIALPTAAGKTACIDIAVFALAAQAEHLARGETVTAPRRVFFVVDRRVIVDEAFERAKKIAQALENPTDPIPRTVRENLLRIAGHREAETNDALPKRPLAAHVLRGGMYRSEAWARDPLQPAVIASTVDQIGSRLLFRAYGRRPGMWPVLAGLTANDSLIFLDEAHCAQPFLRTLHAIRRYRGWAEQPLGRAFHPVVLSATPPDGIKDRFQDDSDQRRDPNHPLGKRQLAPKPAHLKVARRAKGAKGNEKLAERLVKEALKLISEQRRAIVIFVNRVAIARLAYELLGKHEDIQRTKLTGRMRALDKDAVQNELKCLSSEQAWDRRLDQLHIVVATQTLEVGADLDFDGLVTECASLDALRQRFGRLNRMGRDIEAEAVIVLRGDQEKGSDDDPVYGGALTRTWNWLNAQTDTEGKIDFGILSMEKRLPDGNDLAELLAPAPDAPILLPAHLDALAQTSPQPVPEPDIGLFLHGKQETAADVQVVFRADLDPDDLDTNGANNEILSFCPPSSAEALAVPIAAFLRWFNNAEAEDDSSDVEGEVGTFDASRPSDASSNQKVLRWTFDKAKKRPVAEWIKQAKDIHPDDVLVLPAKSSAWKVLGDFPENAWPDLGDVAYRRTRAKNLLRLYPQLITRWPEGCPAREQAEALFEDLRDRFDADPDEVVAQVRDLLLAISQCPLLLPKGGADVVHGLCKELQGRRLEKVDDQASSCKELKARLLEKALHLVGAKELVIVGKRLETSVQNSPPSPSSTKEPVIVGKRLETDLISDADTFSDEDDAASSGTAYRNGKHVLLEEHLPGVQGFAQRFAAGAGLAQDHIDAISQAGLLHDLGKADPRFQKLLRGGIGLMVGEALAKSARMPQTPTAKAATRKASGYPENARHELLSVRMAESRPDKLPQDDLLRDLTLHLIAAHHGYCRPFAPVVFDDSTKEVSFELAGETYAATLPTKLERLNSGVAERFWRLIRTYGWWDLAWLEALMRLADHRRSEWEESNDETK